MGKITKSISSSKVGSQLKAKASATKSKVTGFNSNRKSQNTKANSIISSKKTTNAEGNKKSLSDIASATKSSIESRTSSMLSGVVDKLINGPLAQSLSTALDEAAMIAAVDKLIEHGGDPLYKNGYSIKEFMKRDMSMMIHYIIEKKRYSVMSGKTAGYFNGIKYGATKISMNMAWRKAEIKGDSWYQKNRYAECKKILLKCKVGFDALTVKAFIDTGKFAYPHIPNASSLTGGSAVGNFITNMKNFDTSKFVVQEIPTYKKDLTKTPDRPQKIYTKKMLPSAFGDTGCDECGTKYKLTAAEINQIFPESKVGCTMVTHPKTWEHVVLFKMLMSKALYGEDRLQSELLYKRLYMNVVEGDPVTENIWGTVSDFAKEIGLDKVFSNQNTSVLYDYVKYLVDSGYLKKV